MGEKAPDKVLHQLYVTLEKLKQKGDDLAAEIEKRLRLIVSGHPNLKFFILVPYKCANVTIRIHDSNI